MFVFNTNGIIDWLNNSVWNFECVFTMRQQACLPSMKPLGMALGVRISYLSRRIKEVLDSL